ncbi:hydrogenase maturation nickel metallochaperone HypA [Solihabitans fulvus]|uniref:Hydrogenase maturation factor HypA n=1 Tax=Solihabitans fulvus TaxID=1892852 RepID=A0A5B2XHS5_9PSEU|nr:hydrogenase maturation nickel metallochaperone HypA [Solihabitans fulvus]KAA2263387.1 hydrogenase maturation nickel metallochaperone HypA [Solihabitans fulvus]
MHELSITQSIVDAIVERMGDRRISAVRIEIGALSGVVADSVRFCFEIVAEETTLAGARLDIDEPPGLGRCRCCATEFEVADPILLCPDCGSADVLVLAGRDLRIKSVEVTSACAPPVGAPTTAERG